MAKAYNFTLGVSDPRAYSFVDPIKGRTSIDLNLVTKIADDLPIWAARGKAVEAYAELEQSLCKIMSSCGGMQHGVSTIMLSSMKSTSFRNAALDKLIRLSCGSEYNVFWSSFFGQLRELDIRHDEIVHWLSAAYACLDDEGRLVVGLNLVPPTGEFGDTRYITAAEISEFDEKCSVFSALCELFLRPTDEGSRSIFRRPLIYPLQEDHPLKRPPPQLGR